MKKILLLFILIISNIVFSERLEKVTYRNGVYTATFNTKLKSQPETKHYDTDGILELGFQDLEIKKSIPQVLNVNDNLLERVYLTQIAGISTLSFYMKEDVEYSVSLENRELKITFTKKDKTLDLIKKRKHTIVVDAGHGGKDSGAIGNGYQEKDLALAVAKKLEKELEKDFNVIMTRSTDVFIPLRERAEIGNRANASLFVSIHLNSSKSSSANGIEVFYYSRKESAYAAQVAKFENSFDDPDLSVPFSEFLVNDIFYGITQQKSAEIAADVLDNLVDNFGLRKRGVFGANFAVLRGSNSPSILIELGFVSNYGDVSQYLTESAQERAAKAIADGIRIHFD